MKKFLKTVGLDIRIFFESYFWIPFLASLAITVIITVIYIVKYKNKNISAKHFLSTIATGFAGSFYFFELFYSTLFNRIGTKINPLLNVFGEWRIFDGESSMYLNLKPILNTVLFLPICVITYFIAKNILNKAISHKKLFILTSLFSFSTSIIIELIQLVFCLGTFQVSDLVYNTLGGVMGAIIFATVRKLYRHIKKARTQ